MSEQAIQRLYTKQEIARYLGFSTRWVEMQVKRGMPCLMVGSRPRFKVIEVELWLTGGSNE